MIILGVFPNRYRKFDKKFTAVFYNALPYPVDFYSIDMEGRTRQHSNEFQPGYKTNKPTTFTIPWVFKRANDTKRLFAFVGDRKGVVFKGNRFGAKSNAEVHVIISDNGN